MLGSLTPFDLVHRQLCILEWAIGFYLQVTAHIIRKDYLQSFNVIKFVNNIKALFSLMMFIRNKRK